MKHIPVLLLCLLLSGCASPAAPTVTPTVTALPTLAPTASPTPKPLTDELTFIAPRGDPPVIDGRINPDEWGAAARVQLAHGELLLMQDGDYLYLGIISNSLGLGSVCVIREDVISILHSSAALGTAAYIRTDGGWQKTRDFVWTNRETTNSPSALQARQRHLETEHWLASNGNMGKRGEMEYQIAMTDGAVRLAVTYLMSPEFKSTDFWPETLSDGCRYFEPLSADAPENAEFAPETWMTVIASAG